MQKQSVIAIIPARGGSKRLPRKNIAPFFGKPLLQYAIEACLEAEEITDGVYVSTEDEEIARLARQFGAKVIPRPPALAEDQIWTQEVLQHAVSYLEKEGVSFEAVVRVHSSPQVEANKIDEAVRLLREKSLWEVFSVNKAGVEDAVIHVLQKRCVGQKALSVYKGVVLTDYIDIHTQADLDSLERKEIEKIERNSNVYLKELEKELSHSSLSQELLFMLGRPKKLWAWQMKVPLYQRWQGILAANDELRRILYSPTGYQQAKNWRVLDLGCGFGMYWPILRKFGVHKFVGVDLFDLRKQETYFSAAQKYVAKFCQDCETQLIMDDARNLNKHNLVFDSFDVVLAVATASTKLGSTAIPRDIFEQLVSSHGAENSIPVYAERV